MKLGLNNERVLQYNKNLILFNLFRLKATTISNLSKVMSLSVPAVSRIIKELEEKKLVNVIEDERSGRGKSAGIIELRASKLFIICIDVRPDKLCSVLCDVFGRVVEKKRSTPLSLFSKDALIDCLVKEISFYIKNYKHDLAVALAFHGQVDQKNGISLVMPQAPWHDELHVKFILEKKLNLQVEVDNDCVMRALAQKWYLLRKNGKCEDFCVINVDYGIGSSFLINNEIYRGLLFGSGQIGHTIIDPNGRVCACGRIGCLETLSSIPAICNAVNNALQAASGSAAKINFDEIVKLYKQKDPIVSSQVNIAALNLGRAIYNFLNIININHIFIYGSICELGDDFLQVIKKQVGVNLFDRQDQIKDLATSIEFGSLSESDQIAGIGYLYGEKLSKLTDGDVHTGLKTGASYC